MRGKGLKFLDIFLMVSIKFFSSKDILMRVLAMGLSPVETTIERVISARHSTYHGFESSCQLPQVMTPNPECSTLETTIVDALHIMHDGKFLHLPVIDAGQ